MAWRNAKSLDVLLKQINDLVPNRDKRSDGSIGDAAHRSRRSDHNPWVRNKGMGIVTARDFDHDPQSGMDSYRLAEILKQHKDPRIKYIISNYRIWNPKKSSDWRSYSGSNKHTLHVHVSVHSEKSFYDDESEWNLSGMDIVHSSEPKPQEKIYPLLRRGVRGVYVAELQGRLIADGATLKQDEIFGRNTEHEVREFQKDQGLAVDGIVGPYTWRRLFNK